MRPEGNHDTIEDHGVPEELREMFLDLHQVEPPAELRAQILSATIGQRRRYLRIAVGMSFIFLICLGFVLLVWSPFSERTLSKQELPKKEEFLMERILRPVLRIEEEVSSEVVRSTLIRLGNLLGSMEEVESDEKI